MLTSHEGKDEIDTENLLVDILCLKRITSKMPELAEERKKLIKSRLSVIKKIRNARKIGGKSDIEELLKIHDDLGKKINEIDMINQPRQILRAADRRLKPAV